MTNSLVRKNKGNNRVSKQKGSPRESMLLEGNSLNTEALEFPVSTSWQQRVVFCRALSQPSGQTIWQQELENCERAIALVEDSVAYAWQGIVEQLSKALGDKLVAPVQILPGGEASKEGQELLQASWQAIEQAGIDRHSAVICCGGGAFLDVVGFAAATAHRGVRLVRVPSTSLAQADSAVGVKNGINAFGKKNFLGSFAVPYAVLIDFDLLQTQDIGTRKAGYIEAIKVALIRDGEFFTWIEQQAEALNICALEAEQELVKRSALLHVSHISQGGDPFEQGSSRPLDFGHWAAHKLEQMSNYQLGHGQAVVVGVALDSLYSVKCGLLEASQAQRVLRLLNKLGMCYWHPLLEQRDAQGKLSILAGIEEFREHLGGKLTIAMLSKLGQSVDVHEINTSWVLECIEQLKHLS